MSKKAMSQEEEVFDGMVIDRAEIKRKAYLKAYKNKGEWARDAGVSRRTIENFMRGGHVSGAMLKAILKPLGLEPDNVVSWQPEEAQKLSA